MPTYFRRFKPGTEMLQTGHLLRSPGAPPHRYAFLGCDGPESNVLNMSGMMPATADGAIESPSEDDLRYWPCAEHVLRDLPTRVLDALTREGWAFAGYRHALHAGSTAYTVLGEPFCFSCKVLLVQVIDRTLRCPRCEHHFYDDSGTLELTRLGHLVEGLGREVVALRANLAEMQGRIEPCGPRSPAANADQPPQTLNHVVQIAPYPAKVAVDHAIACGRCTGGIVPCDDPECVACISDHERDCQSAKICPTCAGFSPRVLAILRLLATSGRPGNLLTIGSTSTVIAEALEMPVANVNLALWSMWDSGLLVADGPATATTFKASAKGHTIVAAIQNAAR